MTRKNTELDFWRFVEKTATCWLWTGTRPDGRYGSFQFVGRTYRAHRFVWAITHGPVPSGLYVLHSCDVPQCVNPAHLFLGTQRDNVADMHAKGRANKATGDRNGMRTHPPPRGENHWSHRSPALIVRGTNNGRSVLSEADVRNIRAIYRRGDPNCGGTGLAQKFGVSSTVIYHIISRKLWNHI